jgi:rhodanese-related sulfurtransferase
MPVYIGCATGHRASTAAGILLERGFRPKVMVGASLLGVLMLLEQRRLAESQA